MFCFAHHSSLEWCSELTIQAVFMNGAVFKTLLARGALALPVQFAEEHAFAFGFIFGHACGSTPGVDVDLSSVAVMLVFADEGAIIRVL